MFPMSLEEQLLSAAKVGNLALAIDCLNAGANINYINDDEETALSLAIQNEHEPIVNLLCDREVDFQTIPPHIDNYLLYAALYCNNSKIVDLLQATGKLNFSSLSHEYAYRGDVANLQRVLSQNPQPDLKNNTEVHYSAANGQLEALSLLVKLGFSVTAKNNEGYTSLLIAANNGHLQVTDWLFKNGASLAEKNNMGDTALSLAAYNGYLPVVEWLLQNGASLAERNNDGNTALLEAAYKGQLQVVKWLLQNGASLTERNNDGNTALLEAACEGQLPVVEWLLQNGASLAEKDKYGSTALLHAASNGHLPLVEWLLQNGASLAEKDNVGDTALLYTASNGHLPVVEWLLRNGASLAETNYYRSTALLHAASNGHLPVVEWILQNGTSLAETNNDGNAALLLAAFKAYFPVIEGLLKTAMNWLWGSDELLAEIDKYGNTALLLAASNGYLPVVEWLLKNGASLTEMNGDGDTALSLAVSGRNLPMIERLLDRGALIAQSLTATAIDDMLETCENCLDNKIVIGLQIDGEPVTRELPGFANAITTLDELLNSEELIKRATIDNYFLNLIVTCHQLLPTLYARDKKLVTLLKNKLLLLSGCGLQYASIFAFIKPALENKTKSAFDKLLKDNEIERIPATQVELMGQLYRSISLR